MGASPTPDLPDGISQQEVSLDCNTAPHLQITAPSSTHRNISPHPAHHSGRHLSVITFELKFNPPKSVLCGAEESMARCRLLLASVASETRCSLALKQGETGAGRGGGGGLFSD